MMRPGRKFLWVVIPSVSLILLLGFVAALLTGPADAPDQTIQDQVQSVRLDNGVSVVLAPASGSGLTTVNVWIRAGSAQDPAHLPGLAHFYEHMVFKGSDRFPGPAQDWVEGRGGSMNAGTGVDSTEYHVVIPTEHAVFALELMADLVWRRKFSSKDMEVERRVVMRERDGREDNPSIKLRDIARGMLLGSHPYAQPGVGTKHSIETISVADLTQWASSHYVPGNMIVVVVSDVEQSRLLELVRAGFGAIAPGPLPAPALSEPVVETDFQLRTLGHSSGINRLAFAWAVPSVRDLEELAVRSVLEYLLWLYLQHERGVRRVVFETENTPGLILIECEFPSNMDASEVQGDVLAQLEWLLSGDVLREDIGLSKTWLIQEWMSERRTGISFARQLGWFSVMTGNAMNTFEYPAYVQRVSKRQLLVMARQYMSVEDRLEIRMSSGNFVDRELPGEGMPDEVQEIGTRTGGDSQTGEDITYTNLSRWELWSHHYAPNLLDDMYFFLSRLADQLSARRKEAAAWLATRQWESTLGRARLRMEDDHYVLRNGIRILLLPDPTADTVEIHLVVGAGIGVEAAEEAGLSGFTNDFLLYSLWDDHLRSLDASSRTFSDYDTSWFSLSASPRLWRSALASFLEYIVEPEWVEGHLDASLADAEEELLSRNEDLFLSALLQLRRSLFGAGGYGNPMAGTSDTISSFSIERMKQFHERFFIPDNIVVTAAGDFEPESMLAVLSRELESLEPVAKMKPYRIRARDMALPVKTSKERSDIQLAWVMVGYAGPALSDDDYAAFLVLNSVLGSGMSSRLWEQVREEEGDAYHVSSYVAGLKRGSFINLYAQLLPEDTDDFIETTRAELNELATAGVSDAELQEAVARVVGGYLRQREWVGHRAIWRGKDILYGTGLELNDSLIQQLKEVTAEDIRRLAKEMIGHHRISEIVPAVDP